MYQDNIKIGDYWTGHIQGIAIDRNREYMYCSFTTCLVKADMSGKVLGSVKGLAGHLGCIAYNKEDGRVYGSLEYKHDKIGQDILNSQGNGRDVEDGFYMVAFDVDKIDRIDMDAVVSMERHLHRFREHATAKNISMFLTASMEMWIGQIMIIRLF